MLLLFLLSQLCFVFYLKCTLDEWYFKNIWRKGVELRSGILLKFRYLLKGGSGPLSLKWDFHVYIDQEFGWCTRKPTISYLCVDVYVFHRKHPYALTIFPLKELTASSKFDQYFQYNFSFCFHLWSPIVYTTWNCRG